MSSPARERLTARVAPAGIQSLSLSEPNNIRPKPRIAWHRRPLFSPGLDGDHLVEHLEGPAGEEWTFREPSHSQGVRKSLFWISQMTFLDEETVEWRTSRYLLMHEQNFVKLSYN